MSAEADAPQAAEQQQEVSKHSGLRWEALECALLLTATTARLSAGDNQAAAAQRLSAAGLRPHEISH